LSERIELSKTRLCFRCRRQRRDHRSSRTSTYHYPKGDLAAFHRVLSNLPSTRFSYSCFSLLRSLLVIEHPSLPSRNLSRHPIYLQYHTYPYLPTPKMQQNEKVSFSRVGDSRCTLKTRGRRKRTTLQFVERKRIGREQHKQSTAREKPSERDEQKTKESLSRSTRQSISVNRRREKRAAHDNSKQSLVKLDDDLFLLDFDVRRSFLFLDFYSFSSFQALVLGFETSYFL